MLLIAYVQASNRVMGIALQYATESNVPISDVIISNSQRMFAVSIDQLIDNCSLISETHENLFKTASGQKE